MNNEQIKQVIFNFEIEFNFNDGSDNQVIIEPLWLNNSSKDPSKQDRVEILELLINKFNNPDISLLSVKNIGGFPNQDDIEKITRDNLAFENLELQNRKDVENS